MSWASIITLIIFSIPPLFAFPFPFPFDTLFLGRRTVDAETVVDQGTELRILPLGDSITYGYASPDGNGYRLELSNDLSGNDLVFAGVVQSGDMIDNWMAGYPGKTIQYIADQADASLSQKPNIILLMAGTNDMNPNPAISLQGTDANGAAQRLGALIDQCLSNVPNTVVLVAKIPNAADATQESNTQAFNALIPNVVSERAQAGKQVQLVDMSVIAASQTVDGIHPNEAAYEQMGDIWYRGIQAIPQAWIKQPVGPDPPNPLNCNGSDSGGSSPTTSGERGDISANGGPAPYIPGPVFHHGKLNCEIATGLGHPGDWMFNKNWVSGGQIAAGLKRDVPGVQLFDMDGDGKAEYLWLDATSGELICWHNNYPDPWTPCGNNGAVIASGAGPRNTVFLADMNGDGKADYLTVDGDTGAVKVFWNWGPDADFANGWRFQPDGLIATGVPHANLDTLQFADMDGDGRADYVVVGEGGALRLFLNTGKQGGTDVLFVAEGGIATGASPNISNLVLSDINGDGRADYLVWDDEGGLGGFLNIRTRDEGTPYFQTQGGAKSIAAGIGQNPTAIRLADIDGDGLNDYCYIGDNGALSVWWNRGSADVSVTGDGVRLADIDGDFVDDYVWLDAESGAPTVWLNKGPNPSFPDGWEFAALNGGKPIASGAAPRSQVQFGDLDGDGREDYLVLDPTTGAVTAYINGGADKSAANGWIWKPVGQVAAGLGLGVDARFADIDGDGKVDYIELSEGGETNIWKNNYPGAWSKLSAANGVGVGRPPAEIQLHDVDGDGKADYIWVEPVSGQAHVWYNKYPAEPTWSAGSYPDTTSEGVAGQNVLFGRMTKGGSHIAVFVNPDTGGISAFVNGCGQSGTKRSLPREHRSYHQHPKRELRRRASCSNGGKSGHTTSTASASVTLYQDGPKAFEPTPATKAPLSNCAIMTPGPSATQGLYCDCANSVKAMVSASYNNFGTEYLYCFTYAPSTTHTTIPVATHTPSSIPGSPENPNWANVSCSYGSLPSILNNPWTQWNDSGASAAWQDAIVEWDNYPDKSVGLTNFLANYFHAAPSLNCQELGDQYCTNTINCGQHGEPNAPVSSPAGYIIINSLISIHAVLQNFYGNVLSAQSSINGEIGQFVETFSPVNQLIQNEEHEKLLLDTISIILGAIYGVAFGSWFKATNFAKQNPNALAAGGMVITAETTATFTYIKDALTDTSTLPVQNNISLYATDIVLSWLSSTQGIATGLFNDSDTLYSLINDGKMLTDAPQNTAISEETTLIQALFASILPLTWTTGESTSVPFIMTSDNLTAPGSGGCLGYNPFTGGAIVGTSIPKGTVTYDGANANSNAPAALNTEACYTINGNAYWLVAAKSLPEKIGRGCLPDNCIRQGTIQLSELYGISALQQASSDYGGLTDKVVFENALNTWVTNGYQNVDKVNTPTDLSSIQNFDALDLTHATGLVSIPVCSFYEAANEAYYNQNNDNGNPFWPCPSGIPEGKQGRR